MANLTYVNINLRRKLCYFCGFFFCLHRSREGIRYQTEKITSNFSQFFLILFREGEKYLIHPLSLSLTRMPYLRNVTIDQSTLSFAEMRFVLPLILVLLGLLRVDSFGIFR